MDVEIEEQLRELGTWLSTQTAEERRPTTVTEETQTIDEATSLDEWRAETLDHEAWSYSRRLVLAAAAAVVVFVIVLFALAGDERAQPVITDQPSTTTVVSTTSTHSTTQPMSTTSSSTAAAGPEFDEALATARAFVQGLADGDADRVVESAIDGHMSFFIRGSLPGLGEELAWLDAIGWTMTIERCEVTSADLANTRVACTVSHANTLSEALGVGPYAGAYHMRVLHEGDERLGDVITSTVVSEQLVPEFPRATFARETWQPVVAWLESNHPDDVEVMFAGADWLPGEPNPALSPESIELWRQYAEEFATTPGDG